MRTLKFYGVMLMTLLIGPYLGTIFLLNHIGTRVIEPGEAISFFEHGVRFGDEGFTRPAHERDECLLRAFQRCPAHGPGAVEDDLEALELGLPEIEPPAVARIGVGVAEILRFRPGDEGSMALPHGVGGKQRVVLVLGALEQVELDEARHVRQPPVAVAPEGLEGLFAPPGDPEAVHGNIHRGVSLLLHPRPMRRRRVVTAVVLKGGSARSPRR